MVIASSPRVPASIDSNILRGGDGECREFADPTIANPTRPQIILFHSWNARLALFSLLGVAKTRFVSASTDLRPGQVFVSCSTRVQSHSVCHSTPASLPAFSSLPGIYIASHGFSVTCVSSLGSWPLIR